jgi:transcriptional regulator with PAS, ATPase and Fis domain
MVLMVNGRREYGMSGFEDERTQWEVLDLSTDLETRPLRAKHIVFVDRASHALLNLLDRVAPSDAPIQIAGETGTGKELVARYIHQKSARSGPFCAVNCGAISEHLVESELFGHEAGSFTGAHGRREGWFEAAHGGTLFLDEIGDFPLPLQGKLLRVLQEGEVTRIGSRKVTPVDTRIISASNVDLGAAVDAGRFRRDLLYRLNIVSVQLPPLRDRPGDIEPLIDHFIQTHSRRLKRHVPTIRQDALELLKRYAWPGNIRELENVVHYSLLIAPEHEIRAEHLRIPAKRELLSTSYPSARAGDGSALDHVGDALRQCFAAPGNNLFNDIERRLVQDAYLYCDSHQVRTAELLGVSRNVVRTLLKRHLGSGAVGTSDVETSDVETSIDGADPPDILPARRYDA